LIGDPVRIEGPNLATLRRPSDFIPIDWGTR
jgi:hypothetical protein